MTRILRFQIIWSFDSHSADYLDGSELSLLGGGGRVDLGRQLLVHHPLARQTILQLSDASVDPGHLVLGGVVINVRQRGVEMKTCPMVSCARC